MILDSASNAKSSPDLVKVGTDFFFQWCVFLKPLYLDSAAQLHLVLFLTSSLWCIVLVKRVRFCGYESFLMMHCVIFDFKDFPCGQFSWAHFHCFLLLVPGVLPCLLPASHSAWTELLLCYYCTTVSLLLIPLLTFNFCTTFRCLFKYC